MHPQRIEINYHISDADNRLGLDYTSWNADLRSFTSSSTSTIDDLRSCRIKGVEVGLWCTLIIHADPITLWNRSVIVPSKYSRRTRQRRQRARFTEIVWIVWEARFREIVWIVWEVRLISFGISSSDRTQVQRKECFRRIAVFAIC